MRKSKQQTKIIIILVLLIIGGIWAFSMRRSTKIIQSYPVSEVANIQAGTKIYQTISLHHASTADANEHVNVKKYYLMTVNKEKQTYAQINMAGKIYYVNAKEISLQQANDINQYIAELGYPHKQITKRLSNNFFQKSYATSTGKPQGVVIHDTGTEYSTLDTEVKYMEQHYKADQIFVHTFIDATEIRNIANTKFMAEGAGPRANPYYVQFEMPHEYSAKSFAMQLGNAAYYTASHPQAE